MHRSNSFVVIFSLLKSYSIEALPAPQAEASPCSTIVYLPEATLTISPGPSNALVDGFPDGATSTIEASGPAITIGPNLLSLNAENNVNLNGNVFLFSDGFCPAMVVPITTLDPISSGNGETMSSTSTDVIPVVPGPTDTPPADNDPDDDPDGTPVTPVPVPDPDTPETPNDPADPVDPDPPAGNPTDTPTDNPDEPPSDTPSDPPSDSPDDDPSDDPDLPVIPVPVPAPVDPLPAPDPADPADPVPAPDPADPNDPTITPPPSSPPSNDEPEECETQTANVCTQGCSFGIDTLGATTTTSCNDPSCTTTAACTVSDTTTTTTIITSHSKLSPHTQGPEPKPTPAPEPEPTPEPEPEPSPEPEPEPEPAPEPEPEPTEPEVTNLVFKAGQLTAADGTESIVIYANAPDSPLNICTDKPFYQEATTVGLSKKFDIPDSSYKECDFVGIGNDPLGIYCKDKERVPCVLQEGTELGSCLAGDSGTFSVTWVCNE